MEVLISLKGGVVEPQYLTDGAAGFDITAAHDILVPPAEVVGFKPLDDEPELEIECAFNDPGVTRLGVKRGSAVVETGMKFAIPVGCEMEIRSRSGLAFKLDVEAYNGTIDSDYRGELKVKLINNGLQPYLVKAGERIAQGIIKEIKVCKFVIVPEAELGQTARGAGGFGHTGK